MRKDIIDWFANGEVGASSKVLAATVVGIPVERPSYPLDPDDLRRCVKFLEAVPQARRHLSKLRDIHPVWSDLIDNWRELERTLKEEMAEGTGRAPRTYERMKQIVGGRPWV